MIVNENETFLESAYRNIVSPVVICYEYMKAFGHDMSKFAPIEVLVRQATLAARDLDKMHKGEKHMSSDERNDLCKDLRAFNAATDEITKKDKELERRLTIRMDGLTLGVADYVYKDPALDPHNIPD